MATFSATECFFNHSTSLSQKLKLSVICAQNHLKWKRTGNIPVTKRLSICMVMDNETNEDLKILRQLDEKKKKLTKKPASNFLSSAEERHERKKAEKTIYLAAAILSTLGITSIVAMSFYSKFSGEIEAKFGLFVILLLFSLSRIGLIESALQGGGLPFLEMFGTLAFAVGGVIVMEFWARWAHRALWHDILWHFHESHHRPRDGPFELNDVFVVINSVPAIALLSYGFVNRGLLPALSLGVGLGITIYGMAYMFIHDGLVHRRFPVGPIDRIPYLRRVAAAHQIHHSERHNGVPYGLFLGPEELKEVGGTRDLEKEVQRRIKSTK